MSEKEDNAGILTHPPVFYILAGLIGLGLDYIYPLSFGGMEILETVAIFVFLAGVIVFIMSVKVFKDNKQSPSVHASQPKVLRTGIYGYSRNPIYLGASLWMISVALYFDKVWILLMFVPVAIYISNQVIKKEEEYLEQKFGDDYRDYKKKVRRWI